MGWENATWVTRDINDIYGLKGLHPTEMGWKVKCDALNFLLPDLYTTYLYKTDNTLFLKVYNLTYHYKYPFVSTIDTSLLHYILFYNIGLSLATIIFAITIILTLLYSLNFFTSLSLKDSEKLSPYECGFDPIHSNARIKFDVLYWIIGILYLIFDLEIIFIFPLATILHNLTNPIALLAYLFFMIILTLGFIYEYKKGALKLNI
jgi:NADH-quinone oxidoreductase subunit A